jgi:hypothetical protein
MLYVMFRVRVTDYLPVTGQEMGEDISWLTENQK